METKLDGKTLDIEGENIEKLKTIFPEVFTEGKVDFEKLKQVLGNYVEDSNERYNFTWNGKGQALRLSQTPSLGTLRPCREESKNWDTTENLYIEGDNFEVLKLLQKSYYGKVKVIYIDPPYNTGKDFVYKDDFRDSLKNYKRITGQVNGENNRLSTNTETSGRYHTDWLNMMYPRLRLARNLLTDDGVVFISIDDNEIANLRQLCDEVFGEDNFISIISRITKKGGNKGFFIKPKKDYILFYFKRTMAVDSKTFGRPIVDNKIVEWQEEIFCGKSRLFKRGDIPYRAKLDVRPNQRYYIEAPDGSLLIPPGDVFPEVKRDAELVRPVSNNDKCWTWSRDRYLVEKNKGRFMFLKSERSPFLDENRKQAKWTVYKKVFKGEMEGQREIPSDFIDVFENSRGTKELASLDIPFDYPKPSDMIKHLLEYTSRKDDIILDFFAGSSTTAHAVMQLNAEDGGHRKFIMVQLPELTDEKSEAYKAGYMNICEIGKERIRRAGEKIKEENKDKEGIENLDIGFKVLKLDTSNIREWQPDYDNLEQSLLDYVDNYVKGRTELDVVYEIMLKYGLDLTYPVNEFTIANKKVYSINFGMLMICLDNEITVEVAKGIIAKAKELGPQATRVVFKDNGFKTDSNKTNIKEILKSGGIEEFITL